MEVKIGASSSSSIFNVIAYFYSFVHMYISNLHAVVTHMFPTHITHINVNSHNILTQYCILCQISVAIGCNLLLQY